MEINFEEILDKHIEANTLLDLKKQIVLKAMKEVWNKAIETAIDSVELNYDWEDNSFSINKDLILKLKV